MVNGISGMSGSGITQVLSQQPKGEATARVDHDGDQDDGGPATAGPDVDTATASSGAKGTLFHGVA
jgi:hypothetical protein